MKPFVVHHKNGKEKTIINADRIVMIVEVDGNAAIDLIDWDSLLVTNETMAEIYARLIHVPTSYIENDFSGERKLVAKDFP